MDVTLYIIFNPPLLGRMILARNLHSWSGFLGMAELAGTFTSGYVKFFEF